ncbi:helix-turn-helix transcriptional regulator [Bacillus sp. HC-Mk]
MPFSLFYVTITTLSTIQVISYVLLRIAKSLRNSFGYTQQYVANYLNCTKSGYCYIEQGKRQPSVEKLGKLSQLYNISTLGCLFPCSM